MTVSFRAYVDESGDEGFKFRKSLNKEASSDWFVLAAFVTRKKTDLEVVKVIDQVRGEFQLHPRKHIHWKNLKHPQKVRYSQIISALQARIIAVCVHNPDKWGGDGTVKIIFSNRQGMSYSEMKDYLRLLEKQKQIGGDIRIEFDKIPIDRLETQTPGRSMGLQLADAVAGAFFNAIERDKFGNTEPRYLRTIMPILYHHNNRCKGYGFKIVPRETATNLKEDGNLKWFLGM